MAGCACLVAGYIGIPGGCDSQGGSADQSARGRRQTQPLSEWPTRVAGSARGTENRMLTQAHACIHVALPCCLFDLACFFLPSFFISHLRVGSSLTRGSSFFLGKVTAFGVLCCFALLFV